MKILDLAKAFLKAVTTTSNNFNHWSVIMPQQLVLWPVRCTHQMRIILVQTARRARCTQTQHVSLTRQKYYFTNTHTHKKFLSQKENGTPITRHGLIVKSKKVYTACGLKTASTGKKPSTWAKAHAQHACGKREHYKQKILTYFTKKKEKKYTLDLANSLSISYAITFTHHEKQKMKKK